MVYIKSYRIPITIDESVIDIIRYLCDRISREEWSGVIFYTTDGSITDLANFSINVKHLYPMQKGSASFTEYAFDDPEFINYRMKNPEVNMMRIGHMHSHNTMNTFFSGTDKDEVNENSEFHNYYLSIITNNFLDFSAAIGFRAKMQTPSIIALNEDGLEYALSKEDVEIEESVVWVDCIVMKELKVPQFIIDRTTKIITVHANKKTVVPGFQGTVQKYQTPDFGKVQSFKNGNTIIEAEEDDSDEIEEALFNEALCLRALSINGNYHIKKDTTITSFLAYLGSHKNIRANRTKYLSELVMNFLPSYKGLTEEDTINPDDYLDAIDSVSNLISDKDTKGKSTFIQDICNALDNYYSACQIQFNNQNIE